MLFTVGSSTIPKWPLVHFRTCLWIVSLAQLRWRLRTLQQLSIKINLSSKCAKVSVDVERARQRDGPFLELPLSRRHRSLSHFTTSGDSSLYHSAVCDFVWSSSRLKGKMVCLFPRQPEGESPASFCRAVFAFALHSCACVMSTSICQHKWEAYSKAIVCQELLFRLTEADWILVIQRSVPLVLT